MMYGRQSIWFLLAGLLLFSLSCQKEKLIPIYAVHEDFQALIDSFLVEAAKRGMYLEIDNLILEYDDLPISFCGKCNSLASSNSTQKIIGINANNRCWEQPSELEALIFHELGHCILGRSHATDTLPNGDPKSLMVDGNITLYAPCRYVFGPDASECNNVHKRTYYLDELFDPETPVPEWSK